MARLGSQSPEEIWRHAGVKEHPEGKRQQAPGLVPGEERPSRRPGTTRIDDPISSRSLNKDAATPPWVAVLLRFTPSEREINRFASLRRMRSRTPVPPLRRTLQRLGVVLAGILLAVYPLDWAIWRVRVAAGSGMGSSEVTDPTAATLKGNHFEVYSQQTMTVNCSRSLLPEAGAGACWWLRRHPSSVTQY